jgi:cellulose biosynthesis protein BcsQ
MGLSLSYFFELRNPSLTTMKSLEERGSFVLGGVPSTSSSMFDEGSLSNTSLNIAYTRLGIRLDNFFSSSENKGVVFTSSDDSLKSALVCLNLASYFGGTGKRVLVVESDLRNNMVAKITGAPLDGGLSELNTHKEEVEIRPFTVKKGLDVVTGNYETTSSLTRLASVRFNKLLKELYVQYDYIFIHTSPCLERPDCADLSRYAELGVVCCDAKTINIQILKKLNEEMKEFVSRESCFVLENAEDLYTGYQKSFEENSTGKEKSYHAINTSKSVGVIKVSQKAESWSSQDGLRVSRFEEFDA